VPIVTTGAPVAAYGPVREFAGGALFVGVSVVLTRIKGVDHGTEEVTAGPKQISSGAQTRRFLELLGTLQLRRRSAHDGMSTLAGPAKERGQ